ncbi:MAG: hypothetical protein KR126chlam1_00413 [Chlamydiae bacterium]|nr:hypothetical protein [Chlamydiota bacterium]
MNNTKQLYRKIAGLESRLDQYESEFTYLDILLRDCGFPEGLNTLKTTIQELLKEANDPSQLPIDEDDFPTQTLDPFA